MLGVQVDIFFMGKKYNNICNRMAKMLTKIVKRWTRNIGRDSNQLCEYLFLEF